MRGKKGFTLLEVALASIVLLVGMAALANIFRSPLESMPALDSEFRQKVIANQILQNQAEQLKEGNGFNTGFANSLVLPAPGPYADNYWLYTRLDSAARQSANHNTYLQDLTLMLGQPGSGAGDFGTSGGGGVPCGSGTNPFSTGWPVVGLNFTPRALDTTPVPGAPVPHPVSDAHTNALEGKRDLSGFEDKLHLSETAGAVYVGNTVCASEFKVNLGFMLASNGAPASLLGNQVRLYFRNKVDALGKLTTDSYRATVVIDGVGAVIGGNQRYNGKLALVNVSTGATLANISLPADGFREHVWYKLQAHVNIVANQNQIVLTLYEEGGGGAITTATPGSFVSIATLSYTDAAGVRTNLTQYKGIGASSLSPNTATYGSVAEDGPTLGGAKLPFFAKPHTTDDSFQRPASIFGFSESVRDYAVMDTKPFMIADGGHANFDITPNNGGANFILPVAYVGEPYNPFILTGNDGRPPYSWSLSVGSLPPDFDFITYSDPAVPANNNKFQVRLKPAFSTVPVGSAGTFTFRVLGTKTPDDAVAGHRRERRYQLTVTNFFINPTGLGPPDRRELQPATAGDFYPPVVIEANGGVGITYEWKFPGSGFLTTTSGPYQLSNEDGNCEGLVAEVFNDGTGEHKLRIRVDNVTYPDNKVPTTSLGNCNFDLRARDDGGAQTSGTENRFTIRVDRISIASPLVNTTFYISADVAVPVNTFVQPYLASYTGNNFPLSWTLRNGVVAPPGGTNVVPAWLTDPMPVIGAPSTSLSAELRNDGVIGANCDGNGCPFIYDFIVRAEDNNGRRNDVPYRIILSRVSINDNPLPDGMNGQPYPTNPVAPFTATGGTLPYTWSIVSEDAPWAMTIDPATGQLASSAPTNASCSVACPQTYNLRIRVVDAMGIPAERTFPFKIVDLAIINPASFYTYYIAAAAGVAANSWVSTPPAHEAMYNGANFPLTWSLNGAVPAWLSARTLGDPATSLLGEIYNSGAIAVNCDGNGCPYTYTFMVRATDNAGKYHELPYKIRLSDVAIDSTVMPSGQNGSNYPLTPPLKFTAQGGVAPYTWTLLSENAPWAMSITDNPDNSADLNVGGPATCSLGCPQSYFITLQVSDGNGDTSQRTFSFTIVDNVFDGALFLDDAFLDILGTGGGPSMAPVGSFVRGAVGRLTINRMTGAAGKPGF